MGRAIALLLPTPAWRSEGQRYLRFSSNYLPTSFFFGKIHRVVVAISH